MQLDAIYDDGKLEFSRPVRFAHRRFLVRVDVPELELIEPKTGEVFDPLSAYASSWLRRLESIRAEVMTTPETELPAVSEEQLERLRAIDTREEP
jgi:hypothetical protein